MAVYYYHPKALQHICNKQLKCSKDSFTRLMNKNRISDRAFLIMEYLHLYRLLTEEMISQLVPHTEEDLHKELDRMADYGLIIKEFFQYECDGEEERSQTFYGLSDAMPFELNDKKGQIEGFSSHDGLSYANAMSILSFNAFHLSLTKNTPEKNLRTQLNYYVSNELFHGKYTLKSNSFRLGKNVFYALSVRDFADHNKKAVEKILFANQYLQSREHISPWFVLICENGQQCAAIHKKLNTLTNNHCPNIHFILDTDICFDEDCLKKLHLFKEGDIPGDIISDTFSLKGWY